MVTFDDTQHELLAMVRSLADDKIAPVADSYEREGRFPRDLFAMIADLGLTGLSLPSEHGGGAQPTVVSLRVVEELSRAFLALGLGLSVHNLASWAVATYANPDLATTVVPKLAAGEWLGAYSLSEPGSGSDAAALTCRAELVGDTYVVNGTKAWVTHGGVADVYVLLCRTGAHKTRGISALLVPADTPGLTAATPEHKMGMRSSPTSQLVFDDARVPAANLLGEEGQGFAIAMSALDGGRLGISSCSVGLAQAALDHAVAYARTREQFGVPIGQHQGLAFMLADMATATESARALTYRAAELRDAGEPYAHLASMAKLAASDAAMSVTTDAVQVFGGYGYTEEYPVERLMREAKVLQIVEGTNQVQRLVISRHLLAPR